MNVFAALTHFLVNEVYVFNRLEGSFHILFPHYHNRPLDDPFFTLFFLHEAYMPASY